MWPLRYRLWKRAHERVNRIAWKWAPGYVGTNHPLWAVNNWLGDRWSRWWLTEWKRKREVDRRKKTG